MNNSSGISPTLRGKMGADDFRDYILGFIFYKYLSEKMHWNANKILKPDNLKYREIEENSDTGKQYLKAIKAEALGSPQTCFNSIANLRKRGRHVQVGLLPDGQSPTPLPMDRVVLMNLKFMAATVCRPTNTRNCWT